MAEKDPLSLTAVEGEVPTPAKLARLYGIIDQHTAKPSAKPRSVANPQTPTEIDKEFIRRERIKNDDAEQDTHLKRTTLMWLFWFLLAETVLIFTYAFLQATRWFDFHLEDWSFKLLVTATLAQITGMLYVAVRYLFPKKRGD